MASAAFKRNQGLAISMNATFQHVQRSTDDGGFPCQKQDGSTKENELFLLDYEH